MPVHDWTRVDSGLFHAFHQMCITALCQALNMGALPPEYFALPEQDIRKKIPDVLTLQLSADADADADEPSQPSRGLAVATAPPAHAQCPTYRARSLCP